jgi:hypothetical protein
MLLSPVTFILRKIYVVKKLSCIFGGSLLRMEFRVSTYLTQVRGFD